MEITLWYFVLLLAGGFFPSENVSNDDSHHCFMKQWRNRVSYRKFGQHLINSGSDQQPQKNPHQNQISESREPQMPQTKMFPQLSTYKLLTIWKAVLLPLKKKDNPKPKKTTTKPKQTHNKTQKKTQFPGSLEN